MGPLLLLLVGAVALGLGRRRPAAAGFALIAATVVLVPADLVAPNGYTPLPTLTRVALLAVGAGLLWRDRRVFAVTPVHLAAALFAVTTLITGVILAPAGVRGRDAAFDWVSLVEPLAVFVVTLGALRAADDERLALRVLARVTVVAVVIALLEGFTGISWGRLLGSGGGPLELRAGETRVRVGGEFALAFAWALAALVPAAVTAARRRGVGTELAVLAGCLFAAYLTFSRSAPLAFAVGLGLLVVANRDRRAAVGAVVLAVVLGGVAVSTPAVAARFTADVDTGAIAVRTERLPVVLDAAAQRPISGIGLSGTDLLGIPTTDNAFVLAYVETGVLGVVLLLVAIGSGLVCAGRGLAAPAGPSRSACAAAAAGVVVLVTGGLVFDSLQVRGTADLLWLLLAVGVAASERACGRQVLLRPWTDVPVVRVAVLLTAGAAGLALAFAWPAHTAITVRFETISATRLTGFGDPVDRGRRLVGTTCAVAEQYAAGRDDVRLSCRDLNEAAGVGELRAEAADEQRATAALFEVARLVGQQTRVVDLRFIPLGPAASGQPTAVRTAPVWLPLTVLLLVLLVPSGPLRRLEHRLASSGSGLWRMDDEQPGRRTPAPPQNV